MNIVPISSKAEPAPNSIPIPIAIAIANSRSFPIGPGPDSPMPAVRPPLHVPAASAGIARRLGAPAGPADIEAGMKAIAASKWSTLGSRNPAVVGTEISAALMNLLLKVRLPH